VRAAAPPRLAASVGRIEGLRAAGPGEFVAEYVPPIEAFPQVAIVSAVAGGQFGWTAIPLVGLGEAQVRTTPRAEISVLIGEEAFGPVRANDAGIALVPVRVPPGARHALHRKQVIDLGLPEVPRLHAALATGEVAADCAGAVALRVFAAAEDGAPRRGVRLRLEAGAGQVSPVEEVEPGVYAATWVLQPGSAGDVPLVAAVDGEPVQVARVALSRPPGPPPPVERRPSRRPSPPPLSLSAAARAGVALGKGGLMAPAAGAEVLALRDSPLGQVGLAFDAGLFALSDRASAIAEGTQLEATATLRILALQGLAAWKREGPLGATTIAAGGGAALWIGRLAVDGQPALPAEAWAPALSAAASHGLRAGRGVAFAELRLQHLFGPGSGPLRGPVDLLAFSLGYRLASF
jgi:hypothetical protein